MQTAAVLTNDEISELAAYSISGGQQGAALPSGTPGAGIPGMGYIDGSLGELAMIEGTVKSVRTANGDPYLDVLVKLINSKSEVYTETRTFIIDPDCPITRGEAATDYTTISEGDMVKLTIAGTTAYTIYLEEKIRNIVGTVQSKRAVESTGMGVISIKDAGGRVHELVTTEKTVVTRENFPGIPKWRDIKVGDTAEVSAEYDKIISIAAKGSRNYADVTITKIHVEENFSEITAINELGAEITYPIVPGAEVDPFALRIGYQVRLGLDSQEVENILILAGGKSDEMNGYIYNITNSSIILRDHQASTTYKTVFYDGSTAVTNVNTGQKLALADLRLNMLVHVVYNTVGSVSYVSEIDILGY
jgi:hypothetical protein